MTETNINDDNLFWPEMQTTPANEFENRKATLRKELDRLKDKIEGDPELITPVLDEAFLMDFIRLSHFDHQKAFKVIKSYFRSMKRNIEYPPSDNSFNNSGVSQEKYNTTLFHPEILTTPSEEISEKLDMVKHQLCLLKDKLAEKPNLYVPRDDDAFFLRFLRARKYNCNMAYRLIKMYYRNRKRNQYLFQDFVPSAMVKYFSSNMVGMSRVLDEEGRVIAFIRGGLWNTEELTTIDLVRYFTLCFEAVSLQPLIQITGVVGIFDLSGLSINHIMNISPLHLKKCVETVQKCLPLKVKGVHFVFEPKIFDITFTIIKQFLSQKIRSRIHFHGKDMDSLHRHVARDLLPSEYGGNLGPFTTEGILETMLAKEKIFQQLQSYGYKEENENIKE